MKKIYFIISLSFVLSSCKKWVDINNNPNSANSGVPTAEQRLPPLIAQFCDAYESTGTRTAYLSQQLATTYASGGNNYNLTAWLSNSGNIAWPWQCWYVNAAVNITPLMTAAEKVQAWHYIGVAKIMKAWGFGTLADVYGMMPYDQFDDPATITPRFDQASYIQEKVLALLDEAIIDLQKTQGPTAPALAKGDILNNGSTDNWIRLAYGLKARWLNHTSALPGFNPQTVLDAASKGAQSKAQSSVMQYVDEGPLVTSAAKEALQYTNTSTTARITKLYLDYLTNNYTGAPTGAANMEDPRVDLLIPSMADRNGVLHRTKGVDMASGITNTGPVAYTYNAAANSFSSPDSVYVVMRKTPYAPTDKDRIQSTGTWYTRRGGKGLLFTNAELRFIEAEILFNQHKNNEALTAYKAGIRAHMEHMDIAAGKIDAFLNSTSVVQQPALLTLSHIMIQKYIALSYSPELWADLRRLNYCTDGAGNYNEVAGIYKGFKRPAHVNNLYYPAQTDWPRRFAVASYEINYNSGQVLSAEPNAGSPTYLSQPVWWNKKQ
ncbi:SusD/RagB family nutrient-binding outer membrane lipoprotein [Chitinophaga arvensicola]|uniref:Starch-binding associating with outer membrane n=1 Tax=Chitinophaga arvensicola TaxID=29529 RepID=A0A1I0S4J4_9BACT|nr:SusD/RagB family nutrient-binding outer membrane lipoprotein [Chitinophaga arvensicola]SEW49688.1 Starch-binding associating with outer membrane [Chitinophaga arvensicola]